MSIDQIALADEPAAWEALGFTVDGDSCRLGGVTLEPAGTEAGRGILGWSLRGIAERRARRAGDDHLRDRRRELRRRSTRTGRSGMDHVVAMSPSLDRTVEVLQGAGLDLRRIREEPTPAGAPRQAFFRLGEAILEVVQEPAEVLERHGGPDRPARLWGLALLFSDLPRAVEMLGAHSRSGAGGRAAGAADRDREALGRAVGAGGADEHRRAGRGRGAHA